jgi:O-antigen chain-terminating methyltransferase
METTQRAQLAERLSTLAQRVEGESSLVGQLAGRLADFERSINETTGVLAQRFDGGHLQTQQLAARLSELGIFTHQTRASLSIQDRRLSLFMEEFRRQMPNPLPQEIVQTAAKQQAQHRYDSLYTAFEDVFRGTREEIKARQAIYLPLLKEHGVGSPAMPLLDLGCGRGEFLELLREHGMEARGVDLNEAMVERCQSLGLPVSHGDALPFLGTLPDACLGALTAFHMVEHMPFDVVLALVDESLRVLKQGGILILETPNPANVLVGSHTFHLDPTHLKPLPSPMLRFFVEGRGFCNVYVQELHPYPQVVRLPEDGSGIATRINDFLYGPQDYAVIGRKP